MSSSAEEIDLLIKQLGYNSNRQAVSLKAAYINNPVYGLEKNWNRLDERFGSPERIYHATVRRLDQFPRITAKDSSKLYDLSDILSEVEGLKNRSAVGVNPVVSKLPHNLQEKWTSRAPNYKRHSLCMIKSRPGTIPVSCTNQQQYQHRKYQKGNSPFRHGKQIMQKSDVQSTSQIAVCSNLSHQKKETSVK